MYSSNPFATRHEREVVSTTLLLLTTMKNPVYIVQEAGWVSGPVKMARKISPHSGIQSPDRPARSESLYRMSYRGCQLLLVMSRKNRKVPHNHKLLYVVYSLSNIIHAAVVYRSEFLKRMYFQK
jgi:hypothetical protein